MTPESVRDGPLAALIQKSAAGAVIADLKAEGVYDSERRIRPHDDERLALPITRSPEATSVGEVIVQEEPDWRIRDLADRLQARGWGATAIAAAPNSWAVIGDVVIARFDGCPEPAVVGEALLDLHGDAELVVDLQRIAGPHREPDVSIVAGTGSTETVHTEHGTDYGLDLAEVMFAPGNKAERVGMGERVAPDEFILDMFAGVGYFTLPMARAGANVLAVERNPVAFEYLRENCPRNGVTDRVSPRCADCRTVSIDVDRVVMGHYDAPAYLSTALDALRAGGTLHLHGLGPREQPWPAVIDPLETACADADRTVKIKDRRVVKSQGPGRTHVVVDAEVA